MNNQEIREKLLSLSDEKYKAFSEKLTPGETNILGVPVPILKSLAKTLALSKDCHEYFQSASFMSHEEKMLYGLTLGSYKFKDIQEFFYYFDKWLEQVNNWAICDCTVASLKIINKHKDAVLQYLKTKLKQSDEAYVVRAVVVILFSYFLDTHMEEVLALYSQINSGHYYVEMALAWGISVVLIKDFDRGLQYLQDNQLSAWTSNKAIQKACESYRITNVQKEILKKYKKTLSIKKEKIVEFLPQAHKGLNIRIFDELQSTNTYLKNILKADGFQDTLLLAQHQTQGRGRLNRNFFCAGEHGLYASLLLNPKKVLDNTDLTVLVAVAVAKALENFQIPNVKIKWVNDVYIGDKKVCGILTESAYDSVLKKPQYYVVGFGINITLPDEMPHDLQNIVACMYDKNPPQLIKEKLTAKIIEIFYQNLKTFDKQELLNYYKDHAYLTGKNILVLKGDSQTQAVAEAIDDDFRLIVAYENGQRETLFTGEVSIKALK